MRLHGFPRRNGVAGIVLAGLPALLCLLCALLPLLQTVEGFPGGGPRGAEIHSLSVRASVADIGTGVASAVADLDEACEDAFPPRFAAGGGLTTHRPPSPRAIGRRVGTALAPPDKPPRPSLVG